MKAAEQYREYTSRHTSPEDGDARHARTATALSSRRLPAFISQKGTSIVKNKGRQHLNLGDEAFYCRVEQGDVLIPPKAVLVAKGKDRKPRVLPLNRTAQTVFEILADDWTTGEWLFTNRDGKPIKAITKGFAAACDRAGIEDLRSYDLRHTFATRLLERGVHHFVISALLGYSTPMTARLCATHDTRLRTC